MSKNIILATHNPHKATEISDILGDGFEVTTMSDYGLTDDIVEDGETIEENAVIKLKALEEGLSPEVLKESFLLADDTGLFVDYLSGAPGVYSARYAGEDCSFKDNNVKLLKELDGVAPEDRSAYFSTCIALRLPSGETETFTSKVPGHIAEEARMEENGFGYDPVFIEDSTGLTYSEMGDTQKNAFSHRRLALDGIKRFLK